jgi:glycerol-3-phosphate dehydrogenase (NAD+)
MEACQEADILVFVIPHQFMGALCKQLAGTVKSTAVGVSLIKVIDLVNQNLITLLWMPF